MEDMSPVVDTCYITVGKGAVTWVKAGGEASRNGEKKVP